MSADPRSLISSVDSSVAGTSRKGGHSGFCQEESLVPRVAAPTLLSLRLPRCRQGGDGLRWAPYARS